MSNDRSIEMEIEVAGTPEEVWQAIATGPGITSWYVPHTVEPIENGHMSASFGAGEEMQVSGRVAAWQPPARVVFDGGEGVEGLAFEWTVEANAGGTCTVRLVNSGFGRGEGWDDQYDAMTRGWQLFLENLRLHLRYFSGREASVALPMTMWATTEDAAWTALTSSLGIPASPSVGDRIEATADGAPTLAGTVASVRPASLLLLLDEPSEGTAFLAVESMGEQVGVSAWSYLYGDDAADRATREQQRWQGWLDQLSPAVGSAD